MKPFANVSVFLLGRGSSSVENVSTTNASLNVAGRGLFWMELERVMELFDTL